MKKNVGKYKEVTRLPDGALRVALYAEEKGFGVSWFYKRYSIAEKGGKPVDFKIVLFQGSNYVIEKSASAFKKEINNYETLKNTI